jgi:hypothetical protein
MIHLRLRPIPLLTTLWTIAATGRGLQPSTMRAERPLVNPRHQLFTVDIG